MSNKEINNNLLPLVPVRDLVIFPDMIISLFISRDKSVKAVLEVTKDSNNILIVSQKSLEEENPKESDLYKVGCLVEILQIVKIPNDTIKILVKGIKRVKINSLDSAKDYFLANYIILEDEEKYEEENLVTVKENVLENFTNYVNVSKKISQSLFLSIKKISSLVNIVDAICSHLPIKNDDKQSILEQTDLLKRVAYVNSLLEVELDLLDVEKKIRDRVKKQMEKNQKDYYLNEQIKAIQKELNNGEELKDEIKELILKSKKVKLSKEARGKIDNEIKKLSMMNPISAEATVVRNYIEWILSIPWATKTPAKIDLKSAEKYLQEDHYGLGKVKERILEYLAVLKKSSLLRAPIICLVGPPGVGKTSLAKSIAKASGRQFVRIALGGVRDEAEIRGHRRTYIGAMPGKIIQSMKKSKVSNPLFLLDEIDKMGSDFRGDPASALLEVLDHEQNSHFIDHYIEVEYDLSNVMFITTANSLNIQEALLDRMEIIELSGYSEEEKLEIAKKHLLPKKMKETALNDQEFSINEEAIRSLIRNYTRESGVRELERVIAMVARKAAKEIVQDQVKQVIVTKDNIGDYMGVPKYIDNKRENDDLVGVATGLAWTRVGGDILYIEVVKIPGKGDIKIITGKLGEVMQESVKAAYSLLLSTAPSLGLDAEELKKYDLHVHVPEGATPKDGPSAGIAMVTAIFSALSNVKVRRDVAMTGEITLRGRVLPIGGVKEKLLAALRFGIKNVIIPADNEKDLIELPKTALKELNIIKVNSFQEVLQHALVENPSLTIKK
ncbi:Endopeptidase La [Candidatus Hepatincolaceae symbiont of Richtersius coronifer]